VIFLTDAYPGETFKGKVVFIDPVFNPKTRTFDIGVIFPDKGGRMKAGMLVRAVINSQLSAQGKVVNERTKDEQAPLVIPASTPLITGKRAVVYVAVPGEKGLFEGREVVLGPKAKDHYVVLGGLKEGEQVVVNGNFKIDSAVQILAKSSMMDIEGGHPATGHHHHGGSEVMDEDYRSERIKSRLRSNLDSKHPEDHGMPSMIEQNDRPRQDKEIRESSTIRRRRPGMYGDTTRPRSPTQGR
jgi:Cu(I)/Ag(I) efflux system membrane fusion protein